MRFRKLRITFSATCGVACVLLIVLWVRSHTKYDIVVYTLSNRTVGYSSALGDIALLNLGDTYDNEPGTWHVFCNEITADQQPFPPTWFLSWHPGDFIMAYWLPTLTAALIATIAAKPWISRNFSLRTLLIATMLVAAVLGLAVYAARG